MPKVSVIIPVYGVEKYIERCARSLFEQTLDEIEFIFVDDCTPDHSIEILKSIIEEYRLRFAEKKHTVRIERMPTNSGQAAVRRHGVKLATGDYIIHCDSDDWVDRNMYKDMYEKAVEDDADMVVCDFVVTDGNDLSSVIIGCHANNQKRFINNLLLQRDHWSLCNKLIKKSIYSREEITFPSDAMGEDMATVLQLSWFCNRIAYINSPLYFYYQNPDSITKGLDEIKVINHYYGLDRNVKIVLAFYKGKDVGLRFKLLLDWIYFRSANALISHIDIYYQEYRAHFYRKNLRFLMNPYISIARKIRHFLILIYLYR